MIEKTGAAPIAGDAFSAAMKQMVSVSTTAFENISQMAKQMTDIVDTNVKAATSATAQAAAAHTLMESNQHVGKLVLSWA